ncbi:MAG: hypothetical protein LCH77_16035 [Actinobacteria bacterium]|uniref:Uncharacterized protein n=1 Tax=Nostocoides veronense TaxID=330836 RepID=A0ABN2LEW8_9MICO|nr:hypothetical protein [Actinomycetota bacterium]
MTIRLRATVLLATAALSLSACGGSDSGTSTTTKAAGSTTSRGTTASSSSTSATSSSTSASAGGSGSYDAAACMAAGGVLMGIATVALDTLTGEFTQEDYDKAFPADAAASLPKDLQDDFAKLAESGKGLIGLKGDAALEKSQEFTSEVSAFTQSVDKACIPR